VLIDNWNVLANSCDSDAPEMDLVESFNELLELAQNDKNVSVAIGVNRDLFFGPELPFYRELKSSP
jgi:hypothetical protein